MVATRSAHLRLVFVSQRWTIGPASVAGTSVARISAVSKQCDGDVQRTIQVARSLAALYPP